MLTALIPWPWRALAVVLLCLAAGVIGWMDGARHEGAKAVARERDAAQAVAARVQALQTQVRETEERHAQALANVSADYQQRMNNAIQVRAADHAALHSGALRLHDPAGSASCGSAAPEIAAGSSGRDDRTPGELSGSAAEFLLDFAHDADDVARQLAACQRIVIEDRR